MIEGPEAGGHLGFKYDGIQKAIDEMDEEVKKIVAVAKEYGEKFNCKIPVFFAGGVYDRNDIDHYLSLPGRAIENEFTRTIKTKQIPITKCRSCLSRDHCDRKTIPYCITEMLLNSVTKNPNQGLVFAGSNVFKVNEMTTVPN